MCSVELMKSKEDSLEILKESQMEGSERWAALRSNKLLGLIHQKSFFPTEFVSQKQ